MEQSLIFRRSRSRNLSGRNAFFPGRETGIRSPLADNLSIAGTSGVSLLEMTSAFGVLARDGVSMTSTALQAVMTPKEIQPGITRRRGIRRYHPQAAYVATSLLKGRGGT